MKKSEIFYLAAAAFSIAAAIGAVTLVRNNGGSSSMETWVGIGTAAGCLLVSFFVAKKIDK